MRRSRSGGGGGCCEGGGDGGRARARAEAKAKADAEAKSAEAKSAEAKSASSSTSSTKTTTTTTTFATAMETRARGRRRLGVVQRGDAARRRPRPARRRPRSRAPSAARRARGGQEARPFGDRDTHALCPHHEREDARGCGRERHGEVPGGDHGGAPGGDGFARRRGDAAALWRLNEERAAETLIGLGVPRGAELLRLMATALNDVDAAAGLVGISEPGRVVGEAQFTLPYGARSVLYKGKELLALVADVDAATRRRRCTRSCSPRSRCRCWPREPWPRAEARLGDAGGRADHAPVSERDYGTQPQPALAALLLSGLAGEPKAAAETVNRSARAA